VIPFEEGSRLEKLLKRRKFLGLEAYVFGEATTGARRQLKVPPDDN
jgi:hypothetical protein